MYLGRLLCACKGRFRFSPGHGIQHPARPARPHYPTLPYLGSLASLPALPSLPRRLQVRKSRYLRYFGWYTCNELNFKQSTFPANLCTSSHSHCLDHPHSCKGAQGPFVRLFPTPSLQTRRKNEHARSDQRRGRARRRRKRRVF
jgi:hypothetical protein